MPSPLFGMLVAAPSVSAARSHGFSWPAVPHAVWLLAGLLAALWPHWIYIARRLVDGSDEPWGVLALLTLAILLIRDRALLAQPNRRTLVASGALAVIAAAADRVLPDLAAAALAMLAVGLFLTHALRRPATALVILLLLTLPVIASLQFYLGYPLRLVVAHASTGLLGLAGFDAVATGASIVHDGTTVLIDAPCAGIGMLWLGSYVAALLSYLHGADPLATARNGAVAAILVLLANIGRNTVLFFPEAGLVQWPSWSHEVVGLAAFAAAMAPLVLSITLFPRSQT